MTGTTSINAVRLRRVVRWAGLAVAALLVLWFVAWLAVPPLVKSQAEQRLSTFLGREVSIGRVSFSPWTLALTIERVRIGAAVGAANREPQFSVERLQVDADLRSLLRLAPVVEAVDIDVPKVRLTRLADGRYDIDDLLTRFKRDSPAAADGTPARFAMYNVRLRGGSIEFDDRPVQRKHRVEAVQLSLPFLSNLPADVAVNVEPRLAFTLDGAAFDSGAQSRPFAEDRASQLELRIDALDLAPWLPYFPSGMPLHPSRGVFACQLKIQFALPQGAPPSVTVTGQATLRDGALVSGAGNRGTLATWRQLQIGLANVQPMAHRIGLGTVALEGAHFDLRRAADGSLDLLAADSLAGKTKPADAAAPALSASASNGPGAKDGWAVHVERIALTDTRIDWRDAATQPAAALRAEAVEVLVHKLRWPFEAPAELEATGRIGNADSAESAPLSIKGTVSDREAMVTLEVKALDLHWLAPYVAQSLVPALEGHLALRATVDWAGGEQPRMVLSKLNISAMDLRVAESERARAGSATPQRKSAKPPPDAMTVPSFEIIDGDVDLLARRATFGAVKIERPALHVHRDRQGRWNMLAWARPNSPGASSPVAQRRAEWHVELHEAELRGGELHLRDERPSPEVAGLPADAVRVTATGVRARVSRLVWPGAAPARAQLQFRLTAGSEAAAGLTPASAKTSNASGRVEWNGRFVPTPLQVRGTLNIDHAPVHAFEPYFGNSLNLDLLRADASWRGEVAVAHRSTGLEASARGDVLLGDVRVHERLAGNARVSHAQGDELLSWQSFALRGLQFAMTPGSKPTLDIKEASLTDFYSRLVITEQGRFNLRDVAVAPNDAGSAPTTASAPVAATAASAASAATPAVAPGIDLPIDINIGGIQLVNGKIDFTDRFIRPNYSAALSDLHGRLGAFNSASRDMATLDLRGRAAGTALLEISGALNPTAHPLALDLHAKATDLELAPLSPYAGRYAGYAIERGKLSMDVAYKIDADGRLEARNQVILNQLTFGDKVESPDATKLPVQLALALLKDRNGVIDINLPVSGSINDPQFSIFGIVLKIIGNLLVKALTTPFALLAGGGSNDLSFVGFEPGTASLTDEGRTTIDTVAKALADRPALKMTVMGASDPVSEREATQKAVLEARVRAEQRRDALRSGAASDAPLPPLRAAQREPLVRRIYADTKLPDKPRNVIGLAKDIPIPEMESLLRNATPVTNDTARELALQRGLAVRDALIAKGLSSERLFLAAPKLRVAGDDSAPWTPRVQLTLSTQ